MRGVLLLVLWSKAAGWGGRWELVWWKTHMGTRPAPTKTRKQQATKMQHELCPATRHTLQPHSLGLQRVSTFTCSSSRTLTRVRVLQSHFSRVWADQSAEEKPESTAMPRSLVSLIAVPPQHQPPTPLKDPDPEHYQHVGWICAYPCAWRLAVFLCDCTKTDEPRENEPGAIAVMYIIPGRCGWRESSFLCSSADVSSHSSVRAPFIKTSLLWLHQELPRRNDKWAPQWAPLMNQMERSSWASPAMSTETWNYIFNRVWMHTLCVCARSYMCMSSVWL